MKSILDQLLKNYVKGKRIIIIDIVIIILRININYILLVNKIKFNILNVFGLPMFNIVAPQN